MKICLKCNLEKEDDAFRWRNKTKGTRQPYCHDCHRQYDKGRYRATQPDRLRLKKDAQNRYREEMHERIALYLLEHPCVDCGQKDIRFLEFDHLGDKEYNISSMVGNRFSWKKIEQEIEKCVVRCIWCHRVKTMTDYDWMRLKMFDKYQKGML